MCQNLFYDFSALSGCGEPSAWRLAGRKDPGFNKCKRQDWLTWAGAVQVGKGIWIQKIGRAGADRFTDGLDERGEREGILE